MELLPALCYLVAASVAAPRRYISNFAGSYIIYVNVLADGDEVDDQMERHKLHFSHFNPKTPYQPQTVTGNITLPEDFDDTVWHSLIVDIRSANQWKQNYFVINSTRGEGMCSVWLRNVPFIMRAFYRMKATSQKPPPPCVVKAGVYGLDQVPLSMQFPRAPTLPYGRFRFRTYLGKKKRCLSNWWMDLVIMPRP